MAKMVKSPNGSPIIGTYEIMFGCALARRVTVKNGKVECDFDGEVEVDYDSSTSLREEHVYRYDDTEAASNKGDLLFVDSEWNVWTETEILTGKARKKNPKKVIVRSPATLTKAIDQLSPGKLRDFVQQVANRMLLDMDGKREYLDPEKDVNGADLVDFLADLMQQTGLWPKDR